MEGRRPSKSRDRNDRLGPQARSTDVGFFDKMKTNGTLKPLVPHRSPQGIHNDNNHSSSSSHRGNYTTVLGGKVDLNHMQDPELNGLHEKLIKVILSEEENLITSHRDHVDKMCDYSTNVSYFKSL